ncbi:MAG TPA: LLM class flavin-dependent oxidoreductase [Roseiflexaceae bacterium]|nr:LLM class flavin-dependent oxidoreductase [Roseiflexaceae bacterium]
MRFSVRFNNDLPVAAYPGLARAAEAAGFDQFWVSDDLFLRGVWPILSACAIATSRIKLGTCIVNPYTCHPAEIAMQAAALDELSGGRLLLGLAAGASDFLGWVGIPHLHPLATTAEAIRTLRALFRGQRPAHAGQPPRGWTDEAYMRFATRDIPIYLGAMSPRMHRLIGELADGGLPLLFPPERYASVAARVRDGAAAAGRTMADIDLAACVWVSVADDAEQAAQALRDKVAYYGHAFSDEILATLGLQRDAFAEINRLIQEQNNPQAAAALVTDQMLRVGIVGNGRQVRQRVAQLAEQGATHLSFGPPLGPDPRAAIEILGRDVIGALR